jgi:hypothetical protein
MWAPSTAKLKISLSPIKLFPIEDYYLLHEHNWCVLTLQACVRAGSLGISSLLSLPIEILTLLLKAYTKPTIYFSHLKPQQWCCSHITSSALL